jgi:DinB superfamily
MIDTSVLTVRPGPVTEREALRAGLEATRTTFHNLLDSVSGDRWFMKSPASAWTMAEVFAHVTWALEYLPKEIARARRGKGMFNMPKRVADPASYWFIRLTARKSTPESVRRRYDAAIDAAIKALESVPDSDWELGAEFYGEGFHTVADLFRVPAKHLAEHTAGLQSSRE